MPDSVKTIHIISLADLRYEANLHRKTRALATAGFDVHLLAYAENNRVLKYWRGVSVTPLKQFFVRGPLRFLEFFVRALLYLIRTKAERVVVYDVYPLAIVRFMQLLRRRLRFIYDSVELATEIESIVARPLRKWFWGKWEQWGIRGAAATVAVCHSDARFIENLYPFIGGVKVVRNIPELSNMLEVASKLPDYYFTRTGKVGIYQGALMQGRGVELIIRAMTNVVGFNLLIVGDGAMRKALEQESVNRNLQERIAFVGALPFHELPGITRIADFGVVPINGKGTSYYHALPNKLFEYIQQGLPVFGSHYPEIKQVIDQHEIGLTFDPLRPDNIEETLTAFLADQNLEKFRTNVSKIADYYSWEKEQKVYLALCSEHLQSNESE
jgi:glycosyltransferase involved in cell wall biosynthesis